VIKEMNASGDLRLTISIEIEFDRDVSLLRFSGDFRNSFLSQSDLCLLVWSAWKTCVATLVRAPASPEYLT
jgi:hypothetical protein